MSIKIVIVGAANVDIVTKSKAKIVPGDSNPAEVNMKAGGVARNIASMLVAQGIDVSLITAVGDDFLGNYLRKSCVDIGINTDFWIVKRGMTTGVYVAALENDGELHAGFNAMAATECIEKGEIAKHKEIIKDADLLILDLNLTETILAAALEFRGGEPVMIDVVSVAKVPRIENFIGQVDILKLNRLEAERMTGITLDNNERAKQACNEIIDRGVKRVFITLGVDGACAADKNGAVFIPSLPVEVADVTGAGDAFAAGIALSIDKDLTAQAECGVKFAAEHLRKR